MPHRRLTALMGALLLLAACTDEGPDDDAGSPTRSSPVLSSSASPRLRRPAVRPRTTGSFEGYEEVLIGIDGGEQPFRAFPLTDPGRIVIDVRSGR
jgi:hypothetical protein